MGWLQTAAGVAAAPRGSYSALAQTIKLFLIDTTEGDKATAFVRRLPVLSLAALLCMLLNSRSIGIVPAVAEEIRRSTFEGFPLDEPIRFRIRGTLIQVPAGYLAPWPSRAMRKVTTELKDGISFNFWMPDRRYVEVEDGSLADFQPKEPGRYQSSSGTFIFKVRPLRPMKPEELDFRSPEKQFKNLTSTPGLASYSFKQEEFGLVRFWRNDWPYPQPEPFLNYKHIEGTDPQILLQCTPPHKTPANPLCQGFVYSAVDELSLRVYFARKDLPRWRESVLAAIDLFKSWKTAAQ
jgi:hypothetical protein